MIADANNDGILDFGDYLTMLPEHVRSTHPEEKLKLWFMADTNGKGTISRKDFFLWSLTTASRKFSGDGLLGIFQRYDANGSGSIDIAEFTRVVEDMGWDAKTAEEVFDELPVRRDGTVDYLNLLEVFRKSSLLDDRRSSTMALDQLSLGMIWDAKRARLLREEDVGVFDATEPQTLCTQLRNVA